MMNDVKQDAPLDSAFLRYLTTTYDFLRRCPRIAARDAISATFGWATLFGTAGVVYLGHRLGLSVDPGQSWVSAFWYAIACCLIGVLIAFVVSLLLVSPVKSYRSMKPLVLTISTDARAPGVVFNEVAHGYNASVVVRNRSHDHMRDCTALVVDLTSPDGSKFARFVEKFDLPPRATKNVFVAYWCSREAPHFDDKEIGLNGPVGAGLGGNVLSVSSPYDLKIRIEASNGKTQHISCRVSIDADRRKLMTVHTVE